MRIVPHYKLSFLFLLLFSFASCKAKAQDVVYPPYDPDAPELLDIQRTIDASMDDVEDSLQKHGTFKTFATAILPNDSIVDIQVKDVTKNYTVAELEEELSVDALKGNYKVISIFYMYTMPDSAGLKGYKAVAVHAEHTNDDFAYRFEYPFSRSSKRIITFEAPTANFEEQIMFKP